VKHEIKIKKEITRIAAAKAKKKLPLSGGSFLFYLTLITFVGHLEAHIRHFTHLS